MKKNQGGFTLILVLIIILVIAGIAGGAYYLGTRNSVAVLKQVSPAPIPGQKACTEEAKLCPDGSSVGRTRPNCEFTPCPASPSASSTVSPNPSCNKYANNFLHIEFLCPPGWYFDFGEESNSSQVRVDNYNPNNITLKWIKGMSAITVFKPDNVQRIKTKAELMRAIDDSNGEFPSRNEKEIQINGYDAISREEFSPPLTEIPMPATYILDGKGSVVKFILHLDVESGKNSYNQILSTFKFTK